MPSESEIAEFLSRVPLFNSLNRQQLRRLSKIAHDHTFKEGEEIVTQGDTGIGLFVIVSGEAAVCHKQPDGGTRTVNVLHPTDFFGELAMLSEGVRTASVVATQDTECLGITRWNFLALAKNDGEMAVVIMKELARRFQVALGVL
jgi:CRP-like cAMP-binding protein